VITKIVLPGNLVSVSSMSDNSPLKVPNGDDSKKDCNSWNLSRDMDLLELHFDGVSQNYHKMGMPMIVIGMVPIYRCMQP